MLPWQSPSLYCFPEAHITVLAIQPDPRPTGFCHFCSSVITTKCRQLACHHSSILLRIRETFPSDRLLMLPCICVQAPLPPYPVLLTAASSLLPWHCLPQTLVVDTAVTSLPWLSPQCCVLSRCPVSGASAAGMQYLPQARRGHGWWHCSFAVLAYSVVNRTKLWLC